MRIGDISRRTGVPPATLRAWERRYGVLVPTRTEGGHRVYSASDLARVRQLLTLVDSGVSVSLAAQRLRGGGEQPRQAQTQAMVAAMWEALERFDEVEVRALLVEAEAVVTVEAFLDDVVAPLVRRLAVGWRKNPRHIAREHFTSILVRSQLVQVLGDKIERQGPIVVTAAPAGEAHDLGVIMAAVVLAAHGWHPIALGAQTPCPSIDSLLAELAPPCIVLGAEQRGPASRLLSAWSPPRDCLVVLGGPGFRPEDAAALPWALHHDAAYAELPAAVAAATRRRPAGGARGTRPKRS
ncbi:MAG TPA: MerR family transcriptional regulator [Acidimicrobiales bacterium]|nr:MerR family transcriptional regulator [Acidimicrobiales bacterium]